MKRSAFASLCGISRQMVSKHEAAGRLVLDGDQVDAAESLAALEGHLSESARQRALSVLGRGESSTPTGAAADRKPQAKVGKARKEEIEAELKELDLAERKGELVSAAEVDARAREAVALFREARANGRREIADKICAQFGVAADRAPALARFLTQEDEHALGVFARALARLADADNAERRSPEAPAANESPTAGALL